MPALRSPRPLSRFLQRIGDRLLRSHSLPGGPSGSERRIVERGLHQRVCKHTGVLLMLAAQRDTDCPTAPPLQPACPPCSAHRCLLRLAHSPVEGGERLQSLRDILWRAIPAVA